MEDNEKLVADEVTENTEEQTVEEVVEPVKIYSEEDFNHKLDEILPKKLNRREEKIRKEYEKKYGELENILKAGLEVNSIEEATENLKKFYSNKGIQIPTQTSNLSEKQEKILANADADELIETSSIDELKDEIKGLVNKGYENMTSSEKIIFTKLDSYVKKEEGKKELAAAGITSEELNDKGYLDFSSKLNPNMSEKQKYEMYKEYRPSKTKVEPIGSMKGSTQKDNGVKDFYTYEESLQFTREDYRKNPKLMEAIENSMQKW